MRPQPQLQSALTRDYLGRPLGDTLTADGLNREAATALSEMTRDAVVSVDSEARIVWVNTTACRLLARSAQTLRGTDIADLLPHPLANVERAVRYAHGRTSLCALDGRTLEVEVLRPDGSPLPLRLTVRHVNADGQRRFLCVGRDLTEARESLSALQRLREEAREHRDSLERIVGERTAQLRQTIDDLAVANRSLGREIRERESIARDLQRREVQLERLLLKERELSELRSRFVSMASHEFRTPLTTMLSSVEVIDMAVDPKPPMVAKHTRRIRESIGYLRNVLEDFLQLGKLDARGTDLHPQPVDVPALVEELAEDLRLMCKPGQDVELEIEGHFDGPVVHSANALRIVLTNLVTNAIKYSDEGTAIDIRIRRKDDCVVLRVADEGIGIPESDVPLLFERFFRASNAESIKGTGLGLHIVASYVNAMGGEIAAESVEGEGTTFTVRLPYPLELTGEVQSDGAAE